MSPKRLARFARHAFCRFPHCSIETACHAAGAPHNYELLRRIRRVGSLPRHPGTGGIVRIIRQALYLEVADRLRAMIDDHTLMPGAWIDEVALAASLGTSRAAASSTR
jgi:hypothetical protein